MKINYDFQKTIFFFTVPTVERMLGCRRNLGHLKWIKSLEMESEEFEKTAKIAKMQSVDQILLFLVFAFDFILTEF